MTIIKILILFFLLSACKTSNNDIVKESDARKGENLFKQFGCVACHSVNGEVKYGPSLNNIMGKKIEVFRKDGKDSIIVNREYITRSVRDPGFEKASGFQSKKMPVPTLSPDDLKALVDYIIFINQKNKVHIIQDF